MRHMRYGQRCEALIPCVLRGVSGRAPARRALIVPRTPEGSRPTAKKMLHSMRYVSVGMHSMPYLFHHQVLDREAATWFVSEVSTCWS